MYLLPSTPQSETRVTLAMGDEQLTETKLHFWVEFRYAPVDVTLNEDGGLDVHASEEALTISDEEAVYGCWFCNTPLRPDTHETECSVDETDSGKSS